MKKHSRFTFVLVLLIAVGGSAFGQHSTLNLVDPAFNPNLLSSLYGGKVVNMVHALPDGKIIAIGNFSSYNRVPVGKVVRLNPDGSLDATFNTQTVTSVGNFFLREKIILQSDGKIVLHANQMVTNGQPARNLIRLNSDGTLDTSFNFTLANLNNIAADSLGRLVLIGNFSTPQGARRIIRLNGDGSLDNTFNFTSASSGVESIAPQGNKIIVGGGGSRIFRINENGSEDSSFTVTLTTGFQLNTLIVQPDNKILILHLGLRRLNEDGSVDTSFQTANPSGINIKLGNDGKIVATSNSSTASLQRFLSNGAPDPSFGPYTHPAFVSYTISPDNKIVVGDQSSLNNSTVGPNNFVRLNLDGTPDPTFNPGGLGFQNILPGSIRAIAPQPDGKILLGGKFDAINEIPRSKLVRLNADASVDPSFQINTSGTGNYFQIIRDVYQIRTQSDGKIVVSGWFDYVFNGVAKRNLVRLNSDGSMDTAFDLMAQVPDYSEIVGAGRNKFVLFDDGKLVIGTSKLNGFWAPNPLKVTAGGAPDTAFNPTINNGHANLYIDDVAVQPDGKILIAGTHFLMPTQKTFVARLNADGSTDPTFTYSEETGRWRTVVALLPNGKVLVGKPASGIIPGRVERLNADGSADASFNSLSIPNGIINALLSLPNGMIFVGGKFTVDINGPQQQTKNLLRLNVHGNIAPTAYNLNDEVLSLALDSEGRLIVGGSFTVINTHGGDEANRAYLARLTDSIRFDYDGDGKSDVSVFRPSENKWYVLRSSDATVYQPIFAIAGDIPVPADYDGDGKTDVAIFRPSSADWWYLATSDGSQRTARWGAAGDIPRPSDYDGDGRADFVLFRPSNNTWYRASSGSATAAPSKEFGASGDHPVIGDFDGDGKSDLAVYRPSTGDWWYAASSAGEQFRQTHWGQDGDVPVPADYDGDGKTDFAVFRPSDGGWYVLKSSDGSFITTAFGLSTDRPVAADYDGDGQADLAVFRPSTGIWYRLQTTAGFNGLQWGIATDIPTESAFIP